jgi:predicted Zn-dependent protease
MAMIPRFLVTISVAALVTFAAPIPRASATSAYDLPDIGSPADAVLSKSQAEQIGRSVLLRLRVDGQVLEDPELDEYLDSIGHRLVAQAHEGDQEFTFFLVNEKVINAFALPGGYIGVNTGLILQTQRESELAGVMAHEIAHVTQKHIARRASAQSRSSMLAAAAVLAAILMGATGTADANVIQATAMSAQAFAVQQSINYTRVNEYEADRVGLQILHNANFDPYGMPDFFETMGRLTGSWGNRVPEFLLTHPISSTRIAETRSRADQLPPTTVTESREYPLMRERLRVLGAESSIEIVEYYQDALEKSPEPYPYLRYGYGLALIRDGRADDAVPIFHELRESDDSVIAYHSALGQALMASGQPNESLIVFQDALKLFPRNVPLTIRYAEALMWAKQYDQAHAILLDLFNNVPPTATQVRLIANAAGGAGENAEAHYYMAEYYLLNGNVMMAVDQLNQALSQPDLQAVQRARFEARKAQLVPYLPKNHPDRPSSAEAKPD